MFVVLLGARSKTIKMIIWLLIGSLLSKYDQSPLYPIVIPTASVYVMQKIMN